MNNIIDASKKKKKAYMRETAITNAGSNSNDKGQSLMLGIGIYLRLYILFLDILRFEFLA